MITENVSTLKIHKLSQEQYDREVANGRLENNAIYITPDDGVEAMAVDNPTGYGALSINRKADSQIGTNSVATGYNTVASGTASHAEGYETRAETEYSHSEGYQSVALGVASHAEGYSNSKASSDYTEETANSTITSNWSTSKFSLAKGFAAHTEGANCLALGAYSHTEGENTTASGNHSHAEGCNTQAVGNQSHAEGNKTIARGDCQHVQGKYNINDTANKYAHIVGNGTSGSARSNAHTLDWNGNAWFKGDVYIGGTSQDDTVAVKVSTVGQKGTGTGAEVFNDYSNNTASGNYSHAEGYGTVTTGSCSHAEGNETEASGNHSHAEGNQTSAQGGDSHAEGSLTICYGENAHAEGQGSIAEGQDSHAEGNWTTAKGYASHAEGGSTTASGEYSHAEGYGTTSSGDYSHAEGLRTQASAAYSHAEGTMTNAFSECSHAEGYGTTALGYQHVQGHYNNYNTAGHGYGSGTSGTAFVIGNGSSSASTSNAFRVGYDGKVYATSSSISTGADYAEYFEWQDLNFDNEDRRGYFVTLDGDKIKIAEANDYVLGIVSGQPAIIGNGDEDWRGRYILDEFGAFITEEFEYEEEIPEIITDEETGKTTVEIKTVTKTGTKYKENPDYDSSLPYVQRADRPEWAVIGMMGVLSVRDDGTCQVNGYCKVAEGGIATASENGYRVIKRINDHIVQVVFK